MQINGDDLNDSDIMAYSAVNAPAEEGEDSIFSSGGAIMDALKNEGKTDEEILEGNSEPPPKKVVKKAVKKAPAKKVVKKPIKSAA